MSYEKRIIVALDFPNADEAMTLVERLDPSRARLKVGKELFVRGGPAVVEQLVTRGYDVFLDLKFHDIPNTVARACAAAADLGVWMVNVHTLGGKNMMEAARAAVQGSEHKPLLIGVTVLTSMGETDIHQVGLTGSPADNVIRLASLAEQCGLDGVVCSPLEVELLRGQLSNSFKLVTPGIRPAGSDQGDQTRIMTPAQALEKGSDYLVIGRPITAAEDPMAALDAIEKQIAEAS